MHSFKDLNLTWVSREWGKDKQRQTHIRTGIGQHPVNSVCLLYRIELWGGAFAYSWTRRQYYYIQINNETGFMIYSWMKEEGLASLGRCGLCRGTVFRPLAVKTHTLSTHGWTKERLSHFLWASFLGEGFSTPLRVWGSRVLDKAMPTFIQYFTHARLSSSLHSWAERLKCHNSCFPMITAGAYPETSF